MKPKTVDIWNEYYTEVFFFVLKRVKSKDDANEVIQNSFIRIHSNLHTVRQVSKIRSWIFQVVRNELVNFYNQNKKTIAFLGLEPGLWTQRQPDDLCCFDRFVNELPEKYKDVVIQVYFEGKKLSEAAKELEISLSNVKARVRRGKSMLKERFKNCCKFGIDKNGKLTGDPNCAVCGQVYL